MQISNSDIITRLINDPEALKKIDNMALLGELEICFSMDEANNELFCDFTKVKELLHRYGKYELCDVLMRDGLTDAQIPSRFDRQSKKYLHPDHLVMEQTIAITGDPNAYYLSLDEFVTCVQKQIADTRKAKLAVATKEIIRALMCDHKADISSLLRDRKTALERVTAESRVSDWSEVEAEAEAYGPKMLMKTGIEALDEKVRIEEGNILTIGATPNGGKTSMINQMVVNWMLPEQNPHDYSCLYISLENEGKETLSFFEQYMNSRPEYRDNRTKRREARKKFRLYFTCETFDIADIIKEIKDKLTIDPKLKYVVIDYVQLVRDKTVSDGNEFRVVTRVMEALKELKTKNLFIVILSQFDKVSAKEKDEPTQYSLKGAGAIAEMSSYILINMRVAHVGEMDGLIPIRCHVVKARHSKKCLIPLMFNGRQKRFYSVNDDGTIYKQEESE